MFRPDKAIGGLQTLDTSVERDECMVNFGKKTSVVISVDSKDGSQGKISTLKGPIDDFHCLIGFHL